MPEIPDQLEILDLPSYVSSWSVAGIPGFVLAVLKRWQRNHGELPSRFFVVMCPQVEINAMGGLPPQLSELTDPKLRCRHFTGCHKPYFVVIFTDEGADERRAAVQALLPWSEGYEVQVTDSVVRMRFRDATEDIDMEPGRPKPTRSLQDLLKTGELVSILS